MYIIALITLLGALFIRKYSDPLNYKNSINYYLLIIWFYVLCGEMIFALIVTKEDLGIYGFYVVLIVSIASCIALPFHTKKKINTRINNHLNASIFYFIMIFYLIGVVGFINNYFRVIQRVGFKLNMVNLYHRELTSGIIGYFFMIGIAILLLVPYVDIKHKNFIKIIIVLIYALHTRRLYLFCSMFIVFIQSVNFHKVKKIILVYTSLFILILFHVTQVILNKSVYYYLFNRWNAENIIIRIASIFMDTVTYVVGNISNTDKYIEYINNQKYILENSYYALYTFLSNIHLIKPPIIQNPFLHTGWVKTNTISFVSYYIVDGGVIYAIMVVSLIMILNEIVSNRAGRLSNILFPLFLFFGILSFRQNDYIMIYPFVTIIVVTIVDLFSSKRDYLKV